MHVEENNLKDKITICNNYQDGLCIRISSTICYQKMDVSFHLNDRVVAIINFNLSSVLLNIIWCNCVCVSPRRV